MVDEHVRIRKVDNGYTVAFSAKDTPSEEMVFTSWADLRNYLNTKLT